MRCPECRDEMVVILEEAFGRVLQCHCGAEIEQDFREKQSPLGSQSGYPSSGVCEEGGKDSGK